MSKLTLLEQLSQLENPTPVDIDPEEAYSSLSAKQKGKGQANDGGDEDDVSEEEEGLEGRDHYVSVGMSDMRKNADAKRREVEDMEKYGGVRRSRAEIFGNDDSEGSGGEDDEDDSQEEEEEEEEEEGEAQPFGRVVNSSDEEDDDDEASAFPKRRSTSPPAEPTPNLETSQILSSLRNSRSEEQTKGQAVKRQLDLFENFLPLRIKLQKAVGGLHSLKDESTLAELANPSPGTQESIDGCLEQIRTLSEGLFELREGLLKLNEPSLDVPSSKRRKINSSDAPSEYVSLAAHDALALSDLTHPSLLQTLAKWSSKILTAQGLQNLRGEKFRSVKVGVVEQIGASLEGMEGQKKVDRFLGKEDVGSIWGDDKEFYQSLVRDVIERRGGGAGAGALGGQATFSNYGPKKHKPTLDTRASKGRKLRYTPQEKIMNFMVPERSEHLWQEEQVDELFGSLLGNTVREEMEVDENGEEIETGVGASDGLEGGLGGLRVF